jgi:hypothetical protein
MKNCPDEKLWSDVGTRPRLRLYAALRSLSRVHFRQAPHFRSHARPLPLPC